MADDLIRMNFATTANAAASISNCKSVMDNEVADLRSRLGALREVWEGQARLEYDKAMTTWDNASQELNAVLLRTSQAVDECTTIMATSEGNVAGMWGGR
jgi:WXG100 family type VII secretion target